MNFVEVSTVFRPFCVLPPEVNSKPFLENHPLEKFYQVIIFTVIMYAVPWYLKMLSPNANTLQPIKFS